MAEDKKKSNAGRPLKYTSSEDMQEDINAYFEKCKEDKEFPTISGLAFALDMTTHSLRNYEEKAEYFTPIKRAKQLVEMAWEQKLLTPGSGPIFWLKNNAGWRDKQEVEQSGKVSISIQRFTDEKDDRE